MTCTSLRRQERSVAFHRPVSMRSASLRFQHPMIVSTAVPFLPVVQAKLRIGPANDKYEQEADRIAEEVIHMPEPTMKSPSDFPKGKGLTCSDGDLCPKCKEELPMVPGHESTNTIPQSESLDTVVSHSPISIQRAEALLTKPAGISCDVPDELPPLIRPELG
jgi:hypothetical protein